VTLSFHAKDYDGGFLFPYLVVNGRASVEDGGALAVMDHLAQWYIGPGTTYPARDMPSGWTFRVVIDKIYGQCPWNYRWVEMDRASCGAFPGTGARPSRRGDQTWREPKCRRRFGVGSR
jgi:hypothetical protein